MNNPIKTLSDSDQHKLAYLFKAVLISVVPAIIIAYIAYQVHPSINESFIDLPLTTAIVQLVVIAPVIETLLMWPIIALISYLTKSEDVLTAISSACLWAIAHGLFNINWGVTIFWPFFVFSITFCVWRRKSRFWAIVMAASVHSVQNLLAVIYLNFA